jgi:hypothetical protein
MLNLMIHSHGGTGWSRLSFVNPHPIASKDVLS